MKTRLVAAFLGLLVVVFTGFFVWAALRGPNPPQRIAGEGSPVKTLSEQLSDGLIEAQVRALGNLTYEIGIQFSPEPNSVIAVGMPPDINISMETMHMDGFEPPLELVGAGAWRARGKMPMAGRWILSVGFGDEFVELTFDVK